MRLIQIGTPMSQVRRLIENTPLAILNSVCLQQTGRPLDDGQYLRYSHQLKCGVPLEVVGNRLLDELNAIAEQAEEEPQDNAPRLACQPPVEVCFAE